MVLSEGEARMRNEHLMEIEEDRDGQWRGHAHAHAHDRQRDAWQGRRGRRGGT